MPELPPFAIFFAGALAVPLVHGRPRAALLLAIPILGALNLLALPETTTWHWQVLGNTLTPLRLDPLSLLFGYLFHLAAFIGLVFALHLKDDLQQIAGLVYAGSALGAVFSGDLLTLFVFWELLAVSSTFLIWARRTPEAMHAGLRYLLFNVCSGLLLLAGLLIHLQQTGSLTFGYLGLTGVAGWLIFLAFGIKAGFPLLHNWLTDSYPEATPTGTVLLSAFTTKVAIYALARGYPGTELLVYIGAAMTCFPIFYAVIENDLRRVLAYSMINQLGFMVCGIGIGTELALNGAVAHAFNDVIFKGLLFMSMGAVLHVTGRIKGTELGGLYKSMPITTGMCIVGAASISAFPLFSGFVSKSIILSEALAHGYDWVWIALLFASAGVFHHAGIKIPFFAFYAHDAGIPASEPPRNMLLGMGLAAAVCIFIGCYPQALYSLLPYSMDYSPYHATHVIAQLQLLLFSALAFTWLKLSGLYPPELRSVNLDAEWFYRRLAPDLGRRLMNAFDAGGMAMKAGTQRLLNPVFQGFVRHHGPHGVLARSWPTGSMVLWVAILLGVYLVFYYIV